MHYLFYDTETSGLPIDPKITHTVVDNWPRMVSIAWVLCDDDRKIHEMNTFIVKPDGWEIPKAATDVHGISTEKANKDGLPIQDILKAFMIVLNKPDYVVGHNIRFDRKVVAAELYRYFYGYHYDEILYGKKYRDTMHISREFCKILYPEKNGKRRGGFKFPNLSEMYQKLYENDIVDIHSAMGDIKATIKCYWRLHDLGLVDRFYLTHRDESKKEDYLK